MSNTGKYRVKLTFPFDWPILRQTPGSLGSWGDYDFYINSELDECDFWVIFSNHNFKPDSCICNPQNVIFLPCEVFSIQQFTEDFLEQFGLIITCQREIEHKNVSYNLGGHPWFVNRTFDDLSDLKPMSKTKVISLITSNKVFNDGHKRRIDFAYRLKDYFKADIDLFGRGINEFEDKWDVLAPYKYSVAIENDYCDDWLTEKFYDCHLAYCYPFYYGCPNAEKYFDPNSFKRININDFYGSVKIIENIISDPNHYQDHLPDIAEARKRKLRNYNLFPLLVSYFEQMDAHADKTLVRIGRGKYYLFKKLINKIWSPK